MLAERALGLVQYTPPPCPPARGLAVAVANSY